MSDVAVSIDSVSKRFRLYHERGTSLKERFVKAGRSRYDELLALNDVSVDIEVGETIGILGHNGSGKSTLLKCVCGVLQPTMGQVVVQGKLAALLELGAGFQPELSGRDNIYLNGSMLGLGKKEIDDVFDDIVKFSELEQFIDNQVKFYSSGMYVRLGFAVAVNVQPDILVIDEVLAVGDERFQRKCMDRIREFQEMGRTIIFVTHSAEQVRAICDRAVVLNKGSVIDIGTPGHSVRVFRENLLEAGDGPGAVVVPAVEDPEVERTIDFVPQEDDRPVRLSTVQLDYPGVSELPYLKSGDPLSIKVGFVAERAVESVVFAITIVEPKGEILLKTDTNQLDMVFHLDEGPGEMVFQFPSWPLFDGEYKVSVGIQSRLGGVAYDWSEDAVSVEVLYEGQAGGLLNLPLSAAILSGGTALEEPA
ncbi:MAG: ABC transporter ATP-binding protein [Actinomycetes bacterium]